MRTFTRKDSLGARLACQLVADPEANCGDGIERGDVSVTALDSFARRHRRLPVDRIAALASVECDKIRYAWPAHSAQARVELLSMHGWDHADAIVAAVRCQIEDSAPSDRAIKRGARALAYCPTSPAARCPALLTRRPCHIRTAAAFRRAVEQTRGIVATNDGPGALAVLLLQQALSRQSS